MAIGMMFFWEYMGSCVHFITHIMDGMLNTNGDATRTLCNKLRINNEIFLKARGGTFSLKYSISSSYLS